MLILEELSKGTLHSQNVVIEDTAELDGRLLLLALLHSVCRRFDQVLLLADERPSHFFVNTLPAELRSKVTLPKELPQPSRIGERLPVGPLISAVRCSIRGAGQSVGVIIDSVTRLVCTHSASAVPQLVKSLIDYEERGNKVEQVISLIHRDVHSKTLCTVICGRPQTHIYLQPPPSPCHKYGCIITHGEAFKTPSQYIEKFNISHDFTKIVDVAAVSKAVKFKSKAASDVQVDPTADLTFNLSLKPEERVAKDQVILPYTQVSSTGQSSQIHYVPDDADDFDDEDPDDDLDF